MINHETTFGVRGFYVLSTYPMTVSHTLFKSREISFFSIYFTALLLFRLENLFCQFWFILRLLLFAEAGDVRAH